MCDCGMKSQYAMWPCRTCGHFYGYGCTCPAYGYPRLWTRLRMAFRRPFWFHR